VAVLTADELLRGPRGRGVCMAVAQRLDQDVRSAWFSASWGDEVTDHDALVRALQAVDPGAVRAWRDPLSFLEPLDESVSSAMYWQAPQQDDVVAAEAEVVAALRPVAEAVVAAPASAWWSTSVDLGALRYTCRYDVEPPSRPVLAGARERLRRWRAETVADDRRAARERPADPEASYSGVWWSTPAMAGLVTTTRPLPGLGSTELAWEEDSFGQRAAATWSLRTISEPRVWEVDGPRSWTALVDRYPLDVTFARRHDWYRTTGRAGTWRIPDWSAVAEDWDAVHVSVAAYLTTATRALPLADGDSATVLAGWNPDRTWWLGDVLTTTTPEPEWWAWPDDPDDPDDPDGPDGPDRGEPRWRRAPRQP
jgi:hypothetical protein